LVAVQDAPEAGKLKDGQEPGVIAIFFGLVTLAIVQSCPEIVICDDVDHDGWKRLPLTQVTIPEPSTLAVPEREAASTSPKFGPPAGINWLAVTLTTAGVEVSA